jgi:hypothetical protein
MEENFMHTDRLTPEERTIYDDLYVIRDKSKESLKQFRKDLNIHDAVVKRLKKKYGIAIITGPLKKDHELNHASVMLFRVKGKYGAIEDNLEHYESGIKQFTKDLYDFPKDSKRYNGTLKDKLIRLTNLIKWVDMKISSARGELSIANKYLKEATDWEAKEKK